MIKLKHTELITLDDNDGYRVDLQYISEEFGVIVNRYIHSEYQGWISNVDSVAKANKYYKKLLVGGWVVSNCIMKDKRC